MYASQPASIVIVLGMLHSSHVRISLLLFSCETVEAVAFLHLHSYLSRKSPNELTCFYVFVFFINCELIVGKNAKIKCQGSLICFLLMSFFYWIDDSIH